MKAVYAVTPRKDKDGNPKKDWWTRVGAAFVNKDGSLTLALDALPTNGKLIVRDEEPREQGGGGSPF